MENFGFFLNFRIFLTKTRKIQYKAYDRKKIHKSMGTLKKHKIITKRLRYFPAFYWIFRVLVKKKAEI